VKLGFENKKKTMWAAALGAIAVVAFVWQVLPWISGPSEPASSAQAAAPVLAPRPAATRLGTKSATAKKPHLENLDPTLRLDLLAASEKTQYEGNGRNIFVSQAEDVTIPKPMGPGHTDPQAVQNTYVPPVPQAAPPIPLKFYGFASSPGEPKKIFLKNGEDVFVAGEGEIVDRRYKVIRISATSVEIEDMVYSGPPQTIPLTQG
jgi:hypothetical protein